MTTLDHVGKGTLLGSRTLARSRRLSYLYPLVAAAGLILVAWWANGRLERSLQHEARETLQTVLDADVEALRVWMHHYQQTARLAAGDPVVRKAADELLRTGTAPAVLAREPALARIRVHFQPWLDAYGFFGFAIVNRSGIIVACVRDEFLGTRADVFHGEYVERVLEGATVVAPPAETGVRRPGSGLPQHSLMVAAPLRNESGAVDGAVGFFVGSRSFARILQTARAGETGETYAFNADGKMISPSRFEDALREIGLLPDDRASTAVLTIDVRDPGGDLTDGYLSTVPRRAQRLTTMAASAISGESGYDVEGYNDYRGVKVVGAWTWLTDYDFGVATEVDEAEAYQTLSLLRTVFWTLIGLLLALAVAGFVFSRVIVGLQSKVSEAQQLGQYTLDRKIGEGAMGQVYKASHSMLRRPTAIKILPPRKVTEEKLKRFEQEVQLTSRLTHPNTIAIYDYGRSPDGTFYYAMEYLDGVTLDNLVRAVGPLPPALVAHLLRQVCGSLAEAHAAGLIHRDIKPANIMVCKRAGSRDVIKVLDFGLVKDVVDAAAPDLTMAGKIVGTPHYMSPEGLRDSNAVDARSDLYALGAVGYYLLCGTHPFEGAATVMDIIDAHLSRDPPPPSQRIDGSLPPGLETIVLRCLGKDRDARPVNAAELARALKDSDAGEWTEEASAEWWGKQSIPTIEPAPDEIPSQSQFPGH